MQKIDQSIQYRPISRLLIANRGEIAVRIIKTARAMGITTIGIVTDLEEYTTADEKIYLSGDSVAETYLNVEAVVMAALEKKADAIHPGYGFLSETPTFIDAVVRAGMIFVGPSADAVREIGDKYRARELALSLNVPVTQGIYGSAKEIDSQRTSIIYPALIKAVAGGGGKGMIIVESENELSDKLHQAEREALRYFGNGALLIEQLIEKPRHIEVQILADSHGNYVHLFERECSIQRRYQKIVEEAPSLFVDDVLRNRLTNDALKLCQAVGYENAGTVEFLVDEAGNHYFMEVNTRLQVEHPVTEKITGIDIVKQQLLIAMGLPLELSQKDIKINGHVLECRVYAEDPQNDFLPAPGHIAYIEWPDERLARTDRWFDEEVEIHPDFDPMLAKVITHAPTRLYAIEKMKRALQSTLLMGNVNNIEYLKSVLSDKEFERGAIHTGFCNSFNPTPSQPLDIKYVVAATLIWQLHNCTESESSVWQDIGFFRLNQQVRYTINGKLIEVTYQQHDNELQFSFDKETLHCITAIVKKKNSLLYILNGDIWQFNWVTRSDDSLLLERGLEQWEVRPYHYLPRNTVSKHRPDLNGNGSMVRAPIPGKIIEINTQVGQHKKLGDTLLILEAMKMENNIMMPYDGVVKSILIEQGAQVKGNELLVEIENANNKS